MHEASLMRGLMNKIETMARAEKAEKVTHVSIWLGAMSHMSDSHFREHFSLSSPGTLAEGAELEIVVSSDVNDPHAQELILRSIEIDT